MSLEGVRIGEAKALDHHDYRLAHVYSPGREVDCGFLSSIRYDSPNAKDARGSS